MFQLVDRYFILRIEILYFEFFEIFTGDKMTVVAHLVGLEQIGYEKILGMSMGVSIFGTLDNSYSHGH